MGTQGTQGSRGTRGAGISRRRFLHEMGAAGGAAAVLSSMEVLGLVAPAEATKLDYRAPSRSDFSLQGRGNSTRVLVLGAGIAGLCTAYELEKAGYEVEILEARDRPGGRNWTARGGTTETGLDGVTERCRFDDGQYMNVGPARIPQHHTTIDYCRELGVAVEVFANANAQGWYYNEPSDTVSGAWAGQRVRHRTAKADTYGYVSELLAKAVNQGALDAELTADDKEALIEFLRSFGALFPGSAGDDVYEFSFGRGGYPPDDEPGAGFQGGTPIDPAAMSDVLASRLGNYFEFELYWDQAMLMYQPVGGMDRIPYAFEAALRAAPRYGAVITSLSNTDGGVEATYRRRGRTHTTSADYCVCTIPPQILKAIDNNLGAQVNDDLAAAEPVHGGKIGLQYGRRWWEEDEQILGGITHTNLDIGTIWYPSHGFLGRKGVLIGYYYGGPSSDEWAALSPRERSDRALERGARIHGPVYVDEHESTFSNFWQRTRYSEGAWVAWPDGEQPDTPYGRLLEPAGNVYFAGDHLAIASAWQHGALESARLTVRNLHERVLAGG
jgi:monoamine oxidase